MAQAFNQHRLSHEEAQEMSDFRGEIIRYKPGYPESHEVYTVMPRTGDQSRYVNALKVGLFAMIFILLVFLFMPWIVGVLS